MFRPFLTFVVIFLFSHFVVNAQKEIQLELEKVSVDTTTQKITLTWLFNKNVENKEIRILKYFDQDYYPPNYHEYDNQNNYHRYDIRLMESNNVVWSDNDTCTSRNFYSITCDESGKSAPLNNMVLKVDSIYNGCRNSALLTWNPYIYYIDCEWVNQTIRGTMDTIDYYIFYRKKDIEPTFTLLDSIKNSYFPKINPRDTLHCVANYLDNIAYEFVIKAVPKSNPTYYSYSNITSYTPKYEPTFPVHIEIETVSVIEDKYIKVTVNTDIFPTPFNTLYLLRDKPKKEVHNRDSLSFSIIDSIAYNLNNQYSFIDNSANPKSGLYYYVAIADNKCKQKDTSNVLTNIYLSGKRVKKYNDSISFTRVGIPDVSHYQPYELFRLVNDEERFITRTLNLDRNSYLVNVEDYLNDGVQIIYQVKSDDEQYSNTLTIDHEPRIQFPNAFYPKSDIIKNKTFYPIISFPSEKNYLFVIYNRWGQEVYRSTLPPVFDSYDNPQGRWDGTFKGQECPPGIYSFTISYSYNEGSAKYSETGSVMLVR